MVSSVVSSALALLVVAKGLHAHRFDWVDDTLPDCWKGCLDDNGCESQKCICDASQSDSYLPPAVQCAAMDCEAADWALAMSLIMPAQAYCGAIGNPIPDEVISSAYAAATETDALDPEPTTTRKPQSTEKPDNQKTTKKDGDQQLTSIFTSTMTKIITDGSGNTLQLIVPVVMGPNTMSFGKTVTSTLAKETSATGSPSSSAAPSPTPEVSSPASTQNQQQPQDASSTTSSEAPQKTSNSNGSPFENMQAGAGRFDASGLIAGLGAAAGIFFAL